MRYSEQIFVGLQRMSVVRRRKESEIIELLFTNRRIDEVQEYLEENQELDIIQLTDTQDNTVLHQLAYEGHLDIIQLFVKEARKRIKRRKQANRPALYQSDEDQEIANWMNHQNNEGFTALLYASYSGHLDILRYLQQSHANYQLSTKTGLNPLHLSAQKNVVLPFLYFRGRVDLNGRDHIRSTALHWAAYTNSENVAAYILADPQFTSLDQQDDDGNTALMLAVIYGNTRVVRRLLIEGADRSLPDGQGKTPLEVARESNFRTIAGMLDQEYSCLDLVKFYCNVKLEYIPKKRKYTVPIIFLLTTLLNVVVINVLLFFAEWYPLYIQVILFGTMLVLYLSLLWGPPQGEHKDYEDFLKECSQKQLKKVCFECRNYIPRRGYHCDICGTCIAQYDHHCTWINNCVGKRNIGRFIFFLVFLILGLGFMGLTAALAEVILVDGDYQMYNQWLQLRYLPDETVERVLLICLLGLNCGTALFIFPVLALLMVQLRNLFRNRTTYEIMRAPSEQSGIIKSKMKKYNSNKMTFRNCRLMCSDTKDSISSSFTSDQHEDQPFQSKLEPEKTASN